MPIRVRFAPSPTGPFSLGNARTALFNWLFAKHENGSFLVRIEDTDKERSKEEFKHEIIEGLTWLGLSWDNEITYQSKRLALYETYLQKLITNHRAYYCFCTEEELGAEYQAQLSQGLIPKYSGRCRSLEETEAKTRLKKEKAVIRFKMPEKIITFTDLVRGKIEFNTALFGDIIIAKSLREPLYNFAVVIDDNEAQITHVIRGEDHLSNTPKQIALQEALELPTPHYGHLPLILGPDRKKLSKRFLAISLNDYKKDGYLPEAVLNFLVLFGWHPIKDREVITREEMIKEFDIRRVQKGGAVFNPEKLAWLNGHYIRTLPLQEILKYLASFLPQQWLSRTDFIEKIWELEKERIKTLNDFPKNAQFFFELPAYPKELLIWKQTTLETMKKNLSMVYKIIQAGDENDFTHARLEKEIGELAQKQGRGEIFWPLRVALSGKEASPPPVDIALVLGKWETLSRIEHAIEKIAGEEKTPMMFAAS